LAWPGLAERLWFQAEIFDKLFSGKTALSQSLRTTLTAEEVHHKTLHTIHQERGHTRQQEALSTRKIK
jgi:hypothetical protein